MAELPNITFSTELLLPPPVSYLPQTAPAVALLATLALLLAALLWRAWRRFQGNAYRRLAVAELLQLQRQLELRQCDFNAAAVQLNGLLKRAALVAAPAAQRAALASLSGQRWWHYLDRTAGAELFAPHGERWQTVLWQRDSDPVTAAEWQQWQRAAQSWLRRHRAMEVQR